MSANLALPITAVIAVCGYYLFAWLLFGRDPKIGVLVTKYDPPRSLSPAMIRYVWKQRFDDRTFWAGILSLVGKGLAVIQTEDGATRLRATPSANANQSLSKEEEILLDRLLRGKPRKGVVISMLDPHTTLAASDMAISLHHSAAGRWFQENRAYVTTGIFLSVVAVLTVAQPRRPEEWAVLGLSFALMAPAAFYLFFLVMRLKDLIRALCQKFNPAILRRGSLILIFMMCCVASLVFGDVILAGNFGLWVIAVAPFLTILNVMQLQWMKAPTREGASLLTEIEGFRHFLLAVEQLPMQRSDAPSVTAGLYEKYLPYAVALEVEQEWSDRFLALSATFHQNAGIPGAESLYLGMWDGKPVEVIYRPEGRK